MKRAFLPEITYMRGLCMLGVIAIHVGATVGGQEGISRGLMGLLEILSRFTVPAFFFLSAFGLFYHSSAYDSFSYKAFLQRRMRVVLWPYLSWSLIYLLYTAFVFKTAEGLHPLHLLYTFFFGLAYYHLYFMIILLWFYVLMPVWRLMVPLILRRPVVIMLVLFIIQTAFNFYSSYRLGAVTWSSHLVSVLVSQRLNYWVFHYLWIFLLGAVMAERYDKVIVVLERFRHSLSLAFALSVALMLVSYYYVMDRWHYTIIEAIYTVHQLSPMGMVYMATACLFFLWAFTKTPEWMRGLWNGLGEHSYGIYLVHPFILIFWGAGLSVFTQTYTIGSTALLYIGTVIGAYVLTIILKVLPLRIRRILLGA